MTSILSAAAAATTTAGANGITGQGQTTSSASARQSARQTRTNPSRTSKTQGRSSFAYGHGHGLMGDTPPAPAVPHGFYPALTHFTDAITALPREFRRHNSLLKEVDAKAWALEDNLLGLLKSTVESVPVPGVDNPAPLMGGVVREDLLPAGLSEPGESQESKNRRMLFDRLRYTLSDLMMTADEKNHVISNANDELDRQLLRLDSIYPFIAGEISDEARLGSLTHWAYSNRNTAKTVANERPRREAASNKELVHQLQEAEAASRSEARREAVLAKRQRRAHADSDMDDARARKGQSNKARAGAAGEGTAGHGPAGTSGQAKRRKVERPPPVDTAAAMERITSGAGASARGGLKDGAEPKKRSRAPNPNAGAARKRNNTGASNVDSPVLAPSPVVGAATFPRSAPSPGPGATARPQSSRAHQNSGQSSNGRQRPSSSASNRVTSANKGTESRAPPKETPKPETAPITNPDTQRRDVEDARLDTGASKLAAPLSAAREDPDTKPTESIEPGETPASASSNQAPPKGRSSKTSTPVMATFSEPAQQRVRPTRSNDPAPAKRTQKKNGGAAPVVQRAPSEEEESLHEGDDEDEEGEPRYCYCNEISFGEMVACDNDACPREWFHLSCVGLTKPPGKNVKWYCNECKDSMRRSRSGR